MNKTILTAAAALVLTTGISTPAIAADDTKHQEWSTLQSDTFDSALDRFVIEPVQYAIGLLLPAVQKVREA